MLLDVNPRQAVVPYEVVEEEDSEQYQKPSPMYENDVPFKN
jgi:hypothetical protein